MATRADLDEMSRFAFGFLGWSSFEFWSCDIRDYINAREGYFEKARFENQNDNLRAREIAYHVYRLSFIMSKSKPVSKDKFWRIETKSKEQFELEKEARKEAYKVLPNEI
jgi:hypothetical protein